MLRAVRPSVTRASIHTAALRLFAEKGYLATTMADIGAALQIRGPSLYKHVSSKQELLTKIIVETMDNLLKERKAAISELSDPVALLWRMVRDHARYSAQHPDETFVGTREIPHLDDKNRHTIVRLRAEYATMLQTVLDDGSEQGVFHVTSTRLTSFMIIDMIIGMVVWFRPDRELSVDELADFYADQALVIAGAGKNSARPADAARVS